MVKLSCMNQRWFNLATACNYNFVNKLVKTYEK